MFSVRGLGFGWMVFNKYLLNVWGRDLNLKWGYFWGFFGDESFN